MPLDAGGLSDVHGETGQTPDPSRVENYAPTIHSGTDIGEALKAIREFRGLSRETLAETTRIRAAYLAAIEELQLDKLPSRPFVIGYIRAYAQALGADPDVAAERFKAEEPVLDEPLPEPVGLQNDGDPRLAAIIAAAVVIVVAIVAWNVLQRVMTDTAPAPATASDTSSEKALANTRAGPVALGAPLPAPVESTTPPPYETPGLSKAVNADGVPLAPPTVAAATPELNLAAAFTPHGQIYGAPSGPVVLQALKPAFLVVHGTDGSVYFARQLAEGEAYRTPAIGGLTVDVSEPEAFQVFVSGQSKGVLPRPLTDVTALVGAAAPPKPAQAAAKPATSTPTPRPAAVKPVAAASQAPAAKTDPPF